MPAPTQADARLLLEIYDMRREAALRRARDFVGFQLKFKDFKDFNRKYKQNSKGSRAVAMALGYWDLVSTLVDKGLVNEELFQATTFEHVSMWFKLKPVIEGYRVQYQYPSFAAHMEAVAKRHPGAAMYQQWEAASAASKSGR